MICFDIDGVEFFLTMNSVIKLALHLDSRKLLFHIYKIIFTYIVTFFSFVKCKKLYLV